MDLVTYDDYDKISDQVRKYCAQKYFALEQSLVGYVNGDLGEVTPGHVAAYITLIKELGRLYSAQKPPRDPEATIPASQVAKLLEAAQTRQDQAVAAAIAETEARIRGELEAADAGNVAVAREQVVSRLRQLASGSSPGM